MTLGASLGGIGGCPFAPDATGNISTGDLIYMLDRSGIASGYDLDRTIAAGHWLGSEMGRQLPALAWSFPPFPQAEKDRR